MPVSGAEDHRVYFSVTQDGQPVKLQRKLFSECFYVMALSEHAIAVLGRYYNAFF